MLIVHNSTLERNRMKTKIFVFTMALFTVLAFHFGQSFAQNFSTYHQLGPAKATLWRPASGTSNIAIVVMHRTSNFLNLAACREMSNRGFVVLCINTRFDNNESQVIFEQTALDVKAGVLFLRQN